MKHRRKFLLYPLAAVLSALALMAGLNTAAQAGTTRPSAAAIAKAGLEHLLATQQAAGRHSGEVRPLGPTAERVVTNWAGYGDTTGALFIVTGSWTQPRISCPATGVQVAEFWVGLDGFDSDTVEQAGTLAECDNGSAFYFTWYQMFPSGIQIVGTSVQPFDHITASVSNGGTTYAITVTDQNNSQNNFTAEPNCSSCLHSSAEAIAGTPIGTNDQVPNFGSWTPSVTVQGNNPGGTTEDLMVDINDNVQIQPGPLSGSSTLTGSSFTDFWERSD